MQETLDSLVGKVQQRVGPTPGYFLVRDWLAAAFRDELVPATAWSWRRRQASLMFTAAYTTGTVSINRGESVATFVGSAITDTHVGQQLRMGGNTTKIVTIKRRVSALSVEIDQVWTAASQAAVTFEIYRAYHTVPDDFDGWLSCVDLQRGFQLDWWTHTADSLDQQDSQRSYGGDVAWWLVLRDYSLGANGIVSDVVQARGTGNRPTSGGIYTGVDDATFTVEMTSASVFKWKKNNDAATTGVSIDADGIAQDLADGVTVAFPNDVVYTSGDVFTIQVRAALSGGMPRYEAWPHIKADEERPYLYLAKPMDLTDDGAVIPPYVKPGYLVEKALAACARWKNKKNGYYDLKLSILHEERAAAILADMEREDQNRETTDLWYAWQDMPVFDSGFLAGHDVGYEFNVL